MFCSYFERKKDKVLLFNNVHFHNFEISAVLQEVPQLAVSKFNMHWGQLLEEIL